MREKIKLLMNFIFYDRAVVKPYHYVTLLFFEFCQHPFVMQPHLQNPRYVTALFETIRTR
jgi:hypothetical protein